MLFTTTLVPTGITFRRTRLNILQIVTEHLGEMRSTTMAQVALRSASSSSITRFIGLKSFTGGTVVFPPGVYLGGTLQLLSNVTEDMVSVVITPLLGRGEDTRHPSFGPRAELDKTTSRTSPGCGSRTSLRLTTEICPRCSNINR